MKTTIDRPGRKAWLILGLLCLVGCLNYLDRTMITTMRSSIISDMPMTDAQFGLLTSVFLWIYGLLSPFAGYLADRFNRSRVIIISLFVWSVVTWLTAHATTFNQLLATRALMGISEACYIPAALALITDYHRGPTRSLAVGIHMAGIMSGQSLGFLGGWIAESYHWTNAFSVLGGFGIVYSCVLALVLRDAKAAPQEAGITPPPVNFVAGVKELLAGKAFLLAMLFWTLLGIVNWLIVAWLPTFYKENFNLTQSMAGLYATAYTFTAALAGVLAGGAIADAWSKKNPSARILVPAIGLCVAAPCVYLASHSPLLAVSIAGFMVFAFTRSFSDANMMPILCMVANPNYRATGYGVLNMFSCIVGGLSIYASGVLRDRQVSMSVIFGVASVFVIICAGILYIIKLMPETQVKSETAVVG